MASHARGCSLGSCTRKAACPQAWVKSLFAPWLDYCQSATDFDAVYAALQNNSDTFRLHYTLPDCAEAPAYDATCVSVACPVSLGGSELELGTFIVYIAQMVRSVVTKVQQCWAAPAGDEQA